LQQASKTSNIAFKLEWMPFFLNPEGSIPEEGESLKDHIVKKYGPQMATMIGNPNSPLQKAGLKCGVKFNDDRNIFTTLKCHALMTYTKETHGNDNANLLMDAMFESYFEKAKAINTVEVLKECYTSVGLEWTTEAETSMTKSSTYSQQVIVEDQSIKTRRVSGVPFFIIERNDGSSPICFSGAQPSEVIADALEEASATD